ncbi:Glutamyl-tRNA reductase [Dermatophilus congolensis]|uniref:Glutamyl-tRNA reductase n=1 Tax=Dermatophilus congolensis TaxID=1863 RepID=A0AA46BKZ7_9MICO|nr:glutamyl-tRNA reductase [Dermatophilus congolensis]STD02840.1 Glutamyl-tRNA reductase [Dermatophilus congolensis]
MSLVVLGLSHRTSPLDLLERASLDANGIAALRDCLRSSQHIAESALITTCNRIEVYAEARTFHGAIDDIGDALELASGVCRADLADHLYVHYEDRAVAHAFSVACGLDSMAVGEAQILGQMRAALADAQRHETAGPVLNTLFQQALRVGKKAHSDTAIDKAGPSLVERGLHLCTQAIGDLSTKRVVVMGAGAISALAATTLVRAGITDVLVINRTRAKADHLSSGLGLTSGDWDDLDTHLTRADLIVACTGATDHIVTGDMAARIAQARQGRPQAYLDLALPRDIAPEVTDHAYVADLAVIGESLRGGDATASAVSEVTDLVTAEVAEFMLMRRQSEVAPTVAALRRQSADVVKAELARLATKLPTDLDPKVRAEIEQSVRRVATKILHTPTVRVKELASSPLGDYTGALRALFDLDATETATVSAPPTVGPRAPMPGEVAGAIMDPRRLNR